MPLSSIADSFEKGMGGTLGFLAAVIGLGSILGKMLEVSGGAERIARTLLSTLGEQRASWAMMLVGFIVGIPVFFEVGFVLLIPLIYVVARQTRLNILYVGLPLAISLMTVHCMLPPHPAAMAITQLLGADVGKVIIYGLIVGLPTAIVAGPVWVKLVCKRHEPASGQSFAAAPTSLADTRVMPGLGLTLLVILLPLLLMVGKTLVTMSLPQGSGFYQLMSFLGNPLTALAIAVVFAYGSLGLYRGLGMAELQRLTEQSFTPLANILLIIGAGGAFNGVLIDSGVGKVLASTLSQWDLNPILLAWFVASQMHLAVGSATVAMISAAGMVLPLLDAMPGQNREIVVIAIGAGAIGWTTVTDSAFWVVKEYLGVSLGEALKKFTVGTLLASVVALGMTLLVSQWV
jgi:GntP family gluconate:H+ symporter/D-serine transporter